MPSLTHEAPIELIRQHPELAVDLLRSVTDIELPGQPSVTLSATDMSEVIPKQCLADVVVVISDAATGRPVLSVIIESQVREDETKQYSWPVYVASARRVRRCPAAVLLVICPDPGEAVKCARVIRTGHPGFDLAPIVISPQNAPGGNGAAPWLTVFAARLGAKVKAQDVLKILDARHLAPSADQRRQVTDCTDLPQLTRWFDRAITATTIAEVFQADK
jgi:hypothetical protein